MLSTCLCCVNSKKLSSELECKCNSNVGRLETLPEELVEEPPEDGGGGAGAPPLRDCSVDNECMYSAHWASI